MDQPRTDSFDRLNRRVIEVGLVLGASSIAWLSWTLPAPPALEAFRLCLLACFLASMPWIRRRPQDIHWLAFLLTAATCFSIFFRAWSQTGQDFPVLLDLLPYPCFFCTVFGDAALADGLSAAVLLCLGQLLIADPWLRQDPALRHITNLMLILGLQQITLRTLWRYVTLGARDMRQLARSLNQQAEATQAMAIATFQDAREPVGALQAALARADRPAALQAVRVLGGRLAQARQALPAVPEPAPVRDSDGEARALRVRMRAALMLLVCAGLAASLLRNQSLDLPESVRHTRIYLPLTLLVFAFTAAARIRPRFERPLFRLSLALFLAASLLVAREQMEAGTGAFPPVQCAMLFAVLAVALVDHAAFVWPMMAVGIGFVLWQSAFRAAYPRAVGGVIVLVSALCCLLAQRLPAEIFASLRVHRLALDEALRRRRRLFSMLFHDLANPLQVVAAQVELDQDFTRASRLADRMAGVLTAAKDLDQAGMVLQALPLDGLLEGIDDLYRERLAAKALRLERQGGPWLVLVQPQLFRESVLGNLLGNAIKFAPLGGSIRISAQRAGAMVELSLQDSGSGIPQAVLDALARGQRAPSSPGSLGELGNGYGLGLAQDYLGQMGGALQLRTAQGGGTLALVRLQAADA